MHVSLFERLVFVGLFLAVAAIAFFGFRYIIRFGRTVTANRKAGVYDDPEFKRRIRPLNILRYILVGGELVLAVVAIAAVQLGVPPEMAVPIFAAVLLVIAIVAHVVERRWRKLMTKGVE